MNKENQVKTINNLTLNDYLLFEETGDIEYLVKLPSDKNFNVDISGLLQEISSGLYEVNENPSKLQKERFKISSKYRIHLLISLYEAAHNLIVMQADLNKWKKLIGVKPTKLKNLKLYINSIKKATGIEIKEVEDLENLKKEIEEWVNKFAKNFPKDDQDPESLTFIQIVLGVFSILNMSLNYQMFMSDFIDLKNKADEINKMK